MTSTASPWPGRSPTICMPGAAEMPAIKIGHLHTAATATEYGMKGMGEGGAVAPPAAIANAVRDALAALSAEVNETPITPRRVMAAIKKARKLTQRWLIVSACGRYARAKADERRGRDHALDGGEQSLQAALVALVSTTGVASAAALDRIRQDQTVRIAYRADAPPFSYEGKTESRSGQNRAAGWVHGRLRRAVAKHLAGQPNLPPLKIVYVKVTAVDRFDAISRQGRSLVRADDSNAARREQVDFLDPDFR